MAEASDNLVAYWNNMEARSRIGFAVGAVAIVACVALLSWWMLKRDYQVLFAGLEERDAAAIVAELKRSKIPYRVDAESNAIRVPAEAVHETRITLMGRGLNVSGGVGFEIFDNKDLGMTEYTQKINYQRALQGELARTIMAIDDVKLARVHLVLPDASIFKREKGKSKGSVSLVLKPGGRLTAEQIVGIQRLLAAAAPGLEAGMVTVLDQRGIALSPPIDGDGATALGGAQLRMKQEAEQYLTRKAGEVLDRAFGPGQAIVSVDVALNFDEVKRTVQDVVPVQSRGAGESSGVVVRKRQTQQRQDSDGMASRADGGYAKDDDRVNSSSSIETDYDVSRRMEQVVTAPGGIRKLSVGVLVPHGLDDNQTARLRSLVGMAVGLDEQRGDAIAVQGLDQFLLDTARAEGATPGSSGTTAEDGAERQNVDAISSPRLPGLPTEWRLIALILVVLLLGMLASLWLGRRRRRLIAAREVAGSEMRRQELLAEVKGWLASYQMESSKGGPG